VLQLSFVVAERVLVIRLFKLSGEGYVRKAVGERRGIPGKLHYTRLLEFSCISPSYSKVTLPNWSSTDCHQMVCDVPRLMVKDMYGRWLVKDEEYLVNYIILEY